MFLHQQVNTKKLAELSDLYATTDAMPLSMASQGEEQASRLCRNFRGCTNKVIEVVNAGSRYEARAVF